ncbi:hypothetical protein B0H11DRAFT_2046946 [Mycena galericulata]|nr:hypothetical protein B0H11DRAFT_2046946 [Mycena galericulata]
MISSGKPIPAPLGISFYILFLFSFKALADMAVDTYSPVAIVLHVLSTCARSCRVGCATKADPGPSSKANCNRHGVLGFWDLRVLGLISRSDRTSDFRTRYRSTHCVIHSCLPRNVAHIRIRGQDQSSRMVNTRPRAKLYVRSSLRRRCNRSK